MKIKLLLLLMFSGCLLGSAFAQEEVVVDESDAYAVGTKIGGDLKGLNRVSIAIKGGADWLKGTGLGADAISWDLGGQLEVTVNPLWGLGVEAKYFLLGGSQRLKDMNIKGGLLDITPFVSLNLSNLVSKYRNAGWQKLNVYAIAGPGFSIYSWDNSRSNFMDVLSVVGGGLLEYNLSKSFALGLEGTGRLHTSREAFVGPRLMLDANLLLRYKFGGERNVRNVALVDYEPKVASGGNVDQQALAALAKKLDNRLNEQDGKIKRLEDQLKNTQDDLAAAKDKLQKMENALKKCCDSGTLGGDAGTTFANVEFAIGSNVVRSSYYPSLDGLLNLLKQYSDWSLFLKGYADSTGSKALNERLSLQRAESVKNYLVKKGAAASKIQTKGFGIENPIGDNGTATGRAKNRRVEIKLETK